MVSARARALPTWVWDSGELPPSPLPRALTPASAPFGTQVTICLQFKPMRAMDGVARCARGLETRGNDGYGESSPEVRRRTALEGRAISK